MYIEIEIFDRLCQIKEIHENTLSNIRPMETKLSIQGSEIVFEIVIGSPISAVSQKYY